MVTHAPGPDGRTMTVRPGGWRLSVIVPFAFIWGLSIAIGLANLTVDQPVQTVAAFVGPVLLLLLLLLSARTIRLEITDSAVWARQGRWRGHRDLEVPRNDVRAIHYFTMVISFRGPDDEPFMRIGCDYTLRQMRTVAELLGVPLYDHRRWLGLREARIGRLVYKPSASDRVS